ncbi:MAG: hypothetical protein CMF82_03335 [Candidatus Marinimicrobia bacterium]|nr:hypothetical protein [Candidatus Neomarinimicrobiota bacterium]|tara:strand:- start:1446 stop:2009 length:564 start_codon:yes stop_codon:yes gene_type:complete
MREVEVLKIKYNPPSKSYAVLLQILNSDEVTAIPVGTKEANTISMAYEGNTFPRPFTHDIMLDIINNLNCKIRKVIISDIKKGTIFSKIILANHQNNEISIDCRPSDAIIMAIKSYANIFIEQHVIDKIEKSDIDVLSYNNSENLSNLDINSNEIIDNLHSALEKAINDEEYEVAAKIRDRIKQIDK